MRCKSQFRTYCYIEASLKQLHCGISQASSDLSCIMVMVAYLFPLQLAVTVDYDSILDYQTAHACQ